MPPEPSPASTAHTRRPGWYTRDVARATLVVLLILAGGWFFVHIYRLFFVAYLGLLIGLAVSAGAERLHRRGLPRGAGAALVMGGAIALLIAFGAWLGPTIRTQYRDLRERLPIAFVHLDRWLSQRQDGLIGSIVGEPDSMDLAASSVHNADSMASHGPIIPDSLAHVRAVKERILDQIQGAQHFIFPVLHSTVEIASGIVIILFMGIYLGADPGLYRRGILELIPHRRRERGAQVLDAAASALRRWLVTQLIAMITMGAITTVALFALRVRAALPLGILAGLLEFVPTVGPILSAVPSVAMAFIDSPQKAAIVAIAYYFIHFAENHLLIPLLMKEGVNLPPVLTILTQAAMALAFGILGLLIAVPLLVLATILVKMLYVEDVIGDAVPLPYTVERPPPPPPG